MILTVANQKGGVGRSTTAVLLSYAFARAGRNVVLLDMDPVGTSRDWITETYQEGNVPFKIDSPPKVSDTGWNLEGRLRGLREAQPSDTVFILDSGARNIPGSQDTMDVADLVVVPTRPALADIRETTQTLNRVKGPHVVLLAMATQGSPEEKMYREFFHTQGAYVLDTVIPHDPAIAKLHESVPEGGLYGYEELASELESVMQLLGQAVRKRLQQEEWEDTEGGTLFRGIDQRLSSPAYQQFS